MPDITLPRGGRPHFPYRPAKETKVKFGNFLRSVRLHRGMTQRDVSYKLGLKYPTAVSEWERGTYLPSVVDVYYGLIDIFMLDDDELWKFYDLGDDMMKAALRNDERVQKMLELRKEGLTNKQIAEKVGCGVSTVYENIGKRSMDVRKASEQNKPSPVPIPEKPEPDSVVSEVEQLYENAIVSAEKVRTIESVPPQQRVGNLTIRKEVRILEMDGSACNYRVNTGTGEIELVSFDDRASLIEGVLDREMLDTVIGELQSVRTLL